MTKALDELMVGWLSDSLTLEDETELVDQVRRMTNSQLYTPRDKKIGKAKSVALCTSGIEADDIYQIVFLHVYRNRHRWQPGKGKASTWLYWAIRSAIADIRRGDAIRRRNIDLGTFFIHPDAYRKGMREFRRDCREAKKGKHEGGI